MSIIPSASTNDTSQPFVPRTEREYWMDIVNALNAAHDVGMPIGIDLDGTLTDHNAWSAVWDREAERWALAGYDDEDSHEKKVAEYLSTPYTDDFARDLRPGADAARRMIRDRQDDEAPRRRQVTPMELLAHDVESAIAPLKGDAKAGAEMILRYIRTLAAPATIPFSTEDES